MTSKISFFKLTRDEMKKLTWLTAVQCLVFGLLIPFRVLLVMATALTERMKGLETRTAFEVLAANVGLGHLENTFFILAAGVLCAICAFMFLHSSAQIDFYHSLAIKREKLFEVKYLSSVLTFVMAYLSSQILAVLIGMVYGVVSGRLCYEVFLASLQGILMFLCSYSATLLAILLTGKLLTTFFAMGVLGVYIPLIYFLQLAFREVFLDTQYFYTQTTLLNEEKILQYSSPWAFCIAQNTLYQDAGMTVGVTGYVPNLGMLCQLLAVAAILTAVSLLLYRVRKSEVVGRALAFTKTEGIVKLVLTIPTALVAALVAYELVASPIWEFVFILAFGALGCMIMEFIYRGDIRQALSHKWHIAVTALVAAAIFFGFRFDVTGYNTYLPDKEEIASMSMVDAYNDYQYFTDESFTLDQKKVMEELLNALETEEFAPVYEVAKSAVEAVHNRDFYMNEYLMRVSVKYHLKDGKEVYRSYLVDGDFYFEQLEKMPEEYKEVYYPILQWDEEYVNEITNAEYGIESNIIMEALEKAADKNSNHNASAASYSGTETLEENRSYGTVPLEKIWDLVKAYQIDLKEHSYKDTYFTGNSLHFWEPVGKNGDTALSTYSFSASFTNTIKVLEEIAGNSIE